MGGQRKFFGTTLTRCPFARAFGLKIWVVRLSCARNLKWFSVRPYFLFLFLPVVLTVYALLPGLRAKNFWLLLMSLVFYAWGEVLFIFLLLASTLMNYFLGRWVDRSEVMGRRKLAVAVAIAANIGLLAFFKYADFVVATLNSLLNLCGAPPVPQPNIPLPIGISFFTFHALSYVIDIYRRKWRAAKDPKECGALHLLFPATHRRADPALERHRAATGGAHDGARDNFAEGVRRFVGGLAKKMMIANAGGRAGGSDFRPVAGRTFHAGGVVWHRVLHAADLF